MAIAPTDIAFHLSGPGAGDPYGSVGGAMSNLQVDGTSFLPTVTAEDALAGRVTYQCFYAVNTHPDLTLSAAKVWIVSNTASSSTAVTIGLAPEGVDGVAENVGMSDAAPAGVSFSLAADENAALTIGDIAAGSKQAVWVRRVVDAASAGSSDEVRLRVKGSTPV